MEKRGSLFGIIALIIRASGLGVGVFSVVNFQMVEGVKKKCLSVYISVQDGSGDQLRKSSK